MFRLEKGDYERLVVASWEVSRLLEDSLGSRATGLIFEGFEIDYAHAKLIPLFQPTSPEMGDGAPKLSVPQFYATYPGYVTSEDGPEASLQSLNELQIKITQT